MYRGILVSDFTNPRVLHVDPEDVRLRYDLAPADLTPHPAYLETVEDYENAPTGTVICCARDETFAEYVKDTSDDWTELVIDDSVKAGYLAGTRRKVFYWPEEKL